MSFSGGIKSDDPNTISTVTLSVSIRHPNTKTYPFRSVAFEHISGFMPTACVGQRKESAGSVAIASSRPERDLLDRNRTGGVASQHPPHCRRAFATEKSNCTNFKLCKRKKSKTFSRDFINMGNEKQMKDKKRILREM